MQRKKRRQRKSVGRGQDKVKAALSWFVCSNPKQTPLTKCSEHCSISLSTVLKQLVWKVCASVCMCLCAPGTFACIFTFTWCQHGYYPKYPLKHSWDQPIFLYSFLTIYMTLHHLVLTEITSKIVDGNISTTNLTSRLIKFLLKNIPKLKHFQKKKIGSWMIMT